MNINSLEMKVLPFFHDWHVVQFWGDIVLLVAFSPTPPNRAISLPILDYRCPVGICDKLSAYADAGGYIIHAYM